MICSSQTRLCQWQTLPVWQIGKWQKYTPWLRLPSSTRGRFIVDLLLLIPSHLSTWNTPSVSLLKFNCYHMGEKPRSLRNPQSEQLTLNHFLTSCSSFYKSPNSLFSYRFALKYEPVCNMVGLQKTGRVLYDSQDISLRQRGGKFFSWYILATILESFPQKAECWNERFALIHLSANSSFTLEYLRCQNNEIYNESLFFSKFQPRILNGLNLSSGVGESQLL